MERSYEIARERTRQAAKALTVLKDINHSERAILAEKLRQLMEETKR
ncbi:MAG: hypothetical protein NY202_03405 [Mollicutes bacterium UO1]